MNKLIITLAISVTLATISCRKNKGADPVITPAEITQVFAANGDITTTVDAFRNAAGNPNNFAIPISLPSGRREINFDGVPESSSDNNPFPGNFFNVNSQRGLLLSTFGTFRVSSKNFSDINPAFSTQYAPFSPARTIAIMDGTVTATVTFTIPGKDSAAFVHAFGVVFCDVDDSTLTSLEFFENNTSLGKFKVPAHSDGAAGANDKHLSFLGVRFPDKKITSVKIITGNANIDSKQETAGTDLVAMDDFIYSEPVKQN